MIDNQWTYLFLLLFVFTCLFLFLWALIRVLYQDIIRSGNESRNRIVPIRTGQESYIIEIERYNNALRELKNKVIVINPDETISIGTKN